MTRRIRGMLIVGAAVAVLAVPAVTARAHEEHQAGHLDMVVGFGSEPAYVGQVNSVQVLLSHEGEPVTRLDEPFHVEVSFGDAEPLELELEPYFQLGSWGTPGDYRAWFVPTRPGRYTFHVHGTYEGEDVEATITSGPKTFSDVLPLADLQYPVQDPTAGELAERIDRLEPRLTEAVEDVRAEVLDRARSAQAEARDARTIALLAVVVGAIGLAVGGLGFARARRV